MMSGSLAAVGLATSAHAQEATRNFDIPAQSLATALTAFGQQSGLQVSAQAPLVEGKTSSAVRGALPSLQALSQLLAGTGLSFRVAGSTVTLEPAPQADAGTVQLGTLRVEGAGGGAGGLGMRGGIGGDDGVPAADRPYVGAGSRNHISTEQVERFKGTSIGDVLSGQPGVMVGNNRNSGGVDVNIRGMQGQGRVPVVIDGATQEHTAYRGYNGAAGRSYLDPDFIGSIDIEKGPSSGPDAAGATGGVVRVTTIKPRDILLPGEKWGVRVKLGMNGNSAGATPVGTTMEPVFTRPDAVPMATAPEVESYLYTGQLRHSRPGLLNPTGQSASVVGAYETDMFDIVAGYARRRNGNYFAGRGKDAARPEYRPYWPGDTTFYRVVNAGLTEFGAKREIFNTSLDNESFLLKGTLRFDDHALELGYTKYESAFGQVMPTQIWRAYTSLYQSGLNTIDLDTYTIRYKFDPISTDLVELKIDTFHTDMDSRINATSIANGNGTDYTEYFFNRTRTFGATISNKSILDTPAGLLSIQIGAGIKHEKTGLPMALADFERNYGSSLFAAREGWRREFNGFASVDWQPASWITLGANLRYNNYKIFDKNPRLVTDTEGVSKTGLRTIYGNPVSFSRGAWSPIFNLLLEPVGGIQFYGKYAQAQRLPSLFESLIGFSSGRTETDEPLKSEHAKTLEFGANVLRNDVFTSGDKLRFHAAWFDNHIDDYISRAGVATTLHNGRVVYNFFDMINYDYAKMRGLEISGEYDAGIAYGRASWNHYTKTWFCAPEGVTNPAEPLCSPGGLRQSYALQQVPPKDAVTLDVGVRLFDKRLNLGGRMTYIGRRPVEGRFEDDPIDWDAQTAQIRPAKWKPYTLVDLYAGYKFNERLRLDLTVDNVTDRYYIDALSDSLMPAPGRTFRLGLTAGFGPGGDGDNEGAYRPAPFDGNWTGFYLGGGLAQSFAHISGVTTDGQGVAGGNPAMESADQKMKGKQVYIQGGFNWQFPNDIVAGIEADHAWAGLSGLAHTPLTEPADLIALGDFHQARTLYELSDMTTLRARLGYAAGRTLFYGAAGLAWAREREERAQYVSIGIGPWSPTGQSVAILKSEWEKKTRSGWTIGGGVERALGRNWSVKAEYLYADLGRKEFSFPDARAGVGGSATWQEWVYNPDLGYEEPVTVTHVGTIETVNGRIARNKADMHSLRIGVSYRF